MKLLLIEDDEIIRKFLEAAIECRQFELTAPKSLKGFRRIADGVPKFDAVLLDANLRHWQPETGLSYTDISGDVAQLLLPGASILCISGDQFEASGMELEFEKLLPKDRWPVFTYTGKKIDAIVRTLDTLQELRQRTDAMRV